MDVKAYAFIQNLQLKLITIIYLCQISRWSGYTLATYNKYKVCKNSTLNLQSAWTITKKNGQKFDKRFFMNGLTNLMLCGILQVAESFYAKSHVLEKRS